MNLLTILLIVGFFYLLYRLDGVEKALNEYKKESMSLKAKEYKREELEALKKNVQATQQWKIIPPQTEIVQPTISETLVTPEHKPESQIEPRQETFNKDLEFKLGGRIATGIGALAVILGIGFFLRYAFESNLISELMRVILGIFAGLIFLVAGEFTIKKFSTYGQIVSGAGLGILYLSLYAAFNVYDILSRPVAFLGMVIVTAIGVFLATRHNAPSLACFAQLGGFITPLLLSSGQNSPHTLFIYLAILNIGILVIARWKLWRFLNFTSLFGTALIYFLWFLKYYTPGQLAIAEGYASLFFIIFFGISLVQHFIQKSKQDETDLAFLTLNPILYFLISYRLINNSIPEFMGIFTALLAALYLFSAFLVRKKEPEYFRFQQFFLGIGFVFAVLAVPIQFDKIWITVFWAAEALAMVFVGFQMRSSYLRVFAQLLFLGTIFRLLSFDRVLSATAGAWFNERFLVSIFLILCLAVSTWLYKLKRAEISTEENGIFSFLLIESAFVFFAAGTFEINDFSERWLISLFWSLTAVMISAVAFSLKNFAARIFALIVMVAAILKLVLIDSGPGRDSQSWLNTRFFISLIIILVIASFLYLYKIFKNRLKESEFSMSSSGFLLAIYAISIWTLSLEIASFHPKFWLPICWSLCAVLGCILAFSQKNNILRFTVYATLVLIFFRLIGFDNKILSYEGYDPIFNTRFLAFVVGAIAFGIISFMLSKNKEKLLGDELRLAKPSLFLGMNFLLLWLLSSEIIDYLKAELSQLSLFEKRAQFKHFENLRNTALSVGWTLYAITSLIIGIFKKAASSRFLAIFLFGIVVFKVFLFDTANLNNFYRFVSFITLGLILLLAGYLYYRYRDRITQFIKGGEI
jgi:uncharacterized membrane protein